MSVVDISTSTSVVTHTINVGDNPKRVVVSPNGEYVYVTNFGDASVSVIDTVTKLVTDTITVGGNPIGIDITPDGSEVYVANNGSQDVSVIDTSTHITTGIGVTFLDAWDIVVSPNGVDVYVLQASWANTTSVLSTVTKTVTDSIGPFSDNPQCIAITNNGEKAYVTNFTESKVIVIDTATNTIALVTPTLGSNWNPVGCAIRSII